MKSRDPQECVTQKRLKELLSYDPQTGSFTRLVATAGRPKKGSLAGCRKKADGYVVICVDYIHYKAHRLAWLYVTGKWPDDQIDHINGDRHDNRFSNLRAATAQDNTRNTRLNFDNKCGYKGVYKTDYGKWRAQIKVDGVRIVLGHEASPEAAHELYKAAAIKYFGEFARAA